MAESNIEGMCPFEAVPITERPNEITKDIDISDPESIVTKLQQCDAQLFCGWDNHPSLKSEETLQTLDKLSQVFLEVLLNSSSNIHSNAVVFAGCGTSGRLGFALARKFNSLAQSQGIEGPNVYDYLIAGGDVALFTSREIPEDDWKQGQTDLEQLSRGKDRVVYVGITCGLSAPYVAGQLNYCMDNPDVFVPVLIGFNPVELARKRTIEGWSKSFYDVASRLQNHKNGLILNPVVGPEAITGSSRMKGGSATKILLETALFLAHYHLKHPRPTATPADIISCYYKVYQDTYLLGKDISKAMKLAGKSLQVKGHVYYLTWGSLGFMSLLDASECVPTFSASFDDVRAFVEGGFKMLRNREGELSEIVEGKPLLISMKDFYTNFLPNITHLDTVVFICLKAKHFNKMHALVEKISKKQARLIGISVASLGQLSFPKCFIQNCDAVIKINDMQWIPLSSSYFSHSEVVQKLFSKALHEIAVKWILNCISTGAHVLKGKVLRSYMIDVKVSNNKLFHRAVSIILKLSCAGEEVSFEALLKSIYRIDDITQQLLSEATSEHVKVGMKQELVVPLAVLLATGKFNVNSGLNILETETVSKVLQEFNMLE